MVTPPLAAPWCYQKFTQTACQPILQPEQTRGQADSHLHTRRASRKLLSLPQWMLLPYCLQHFRKHLEELRELFQTQIHSHQSLIQPSTAPGIRTYSKLPSPTTVHSGTAFLFQPPTPNHRIAQTQSERQPEKTIPTMSNNKWLWLAPVEGRQARLASDYLGTPTTKPKEQSPPLRRKASVTDLKTKAFYDQPGIKFLSLTPDPPKSDVTEPNTTPTRGEIQKGVKGDDFIGRGEAVTQDAERARSTSADGHDMVRIKNAVDWVDYGFQMPPRQFNNTASVSTQGGSSQGEPEESVKEMAITKDN